jgi:hypothetical protein
MIRNILSMQRKMSDDMMKKHSKNTVNAVPEIPKNQPTPNMAMAPSPNMGMGGPTPMGMQGSMVGDEGPKTPFFIGESAIVKILNPNNPNDHTLWLVNPQKKTLQPFLSQKAFENAFDNPQEAEDSITVISMKELGPGGSLENFTPLQGNKGVKEDGSVEKVDFSPHELKNHYGKPEDAVGENKAMSILDGVFNNMNN